MATIGVCTSCLQWWELAGCYNRLWPTHSSGSPSQFPQRQGQECGGCGGPVPCTHLKNVTSFLRQTMLHFGAFLAVEPLTLIPSVVFTQPTVFLSLNLLS